ncbi:MarR family winged helix-turn-helix transcriptional regulator [Myroides sp. TSA_177.3]|uniref:MarR family winged helix-turn-helix transcriptional regulator n=1 Tax=Myroides sp. TSA_177.3 TaxID=3415650 RepID=UPI004045931B
MHYQLLKDLIDLVCEYNKKELHSKKDSISLDQFLDWLYLNKNKNVPLAINYDNLNWEGKQYGRTPESVINTLIVHLGKYAKFHSKAILDNIDFSSQEDFIYLITLKSFGEMSKIDLIKKNIQDKPAGNKIIDRLIKKGFIEQTDSKIDKRSKIVSITAKGLEVLNKKMPIIKDVTNLVTGDLTENEKYNLIMLLQKLDRFHNPIYNNEEF